MVVTVILCLLLGNGVPTFGIDNNSSPDNDINFWKVHVMQEVKADILDQGLDIDSTAANRIFNELWNRNLITMMSAPGDSGAFYMIGSDVVGLHHSGRWRRRKHDDTINPYIDPSCSTQKWYGYDRVGFFYPIDRVLNELNIEIDKSKVEGKIKHHVSICTVAYKSSPTINKAASSSSKP
jgi:hypothetical protein